MTTWKHFGESLTIGVNINCRISVRSAVDPDLPIAAAGSRIAVDQETCAQKVKVDIGPVIVVIYILGSATIEFYPRQGFPNTVDNAIRRHIQECCVRFRDKAH